MVQIPCPCPPLEGGAARHEQDEVELRERLGFVEAAAVRNGIWLRRIAISEDATNPEELPQAEVLAVMQEGYILFGVSAWTLEDDAGALPLTRANIRRFLLAPEHWEAASEIADAADELYAEAVMLPLLLRASRSSPPGRTPESTSPNPPSGTRLPTPSSPSSTTPTPTDGIAKTTSRHAGGSKSSRKQSSAA